MNDLDLCLEVVKGHVNHCVTFAIEYLGNRQRQIGLDCAVFYVPANTVQVIWETGVRDRGLVAKDHQQEMAYGETNGHVTDDVT